MAHSNFKIFIAMALLFVSDGAISIFVSNEDSTRSSAISIEDLVNRFAISIECSPCDHALSSDCQHSVVTSSVFVFSGTSEFSIIDLNASILMLPTRSENSDVLYRFVVSGSLVFGLFAAVLVM